MFDVSFSELMVIGVIALIVIGPERLPKVARTVGHLLGRAQRYVNDVKSDIRREIELDELRKFKTDMETAAQSVQTSLRDTESSLREPAQALRQELDEAAKAATSAVSMQAAATPALSEPPTDGQPLQAGPVADGTPPAAPAAASATAAAPVAAAPLAPATAPASHPGSDASTAAAPSAAPASPPAASQAPAAGAVDGTTPKPQTTPTGSTT